MLEFADKLHIFRGCRREKGLNQNSQKYVDVTYGILFTSIFGGDFEIKGHCTDSSTYLNGNHEKGNMIRSIVSCHCYQPSTRRRGGRR